jgi:hypothetical protein
MLSDEDKDRILLQEQYRYEVRQKLEAGSKKSKVERVWPYLNGAFSLWVLSAVVAGVISWSYTEWKKQDEAERERASIQKKLDAEISSRLAYAHTLTFQKGVVPDAVGDTLIVLEKPSEGKYPVSVFPDFANRSLRALLWELHQILPDDAPDKQDVERAFVRSRFITAAYMKKVNNMPDPLFDDVQLLHEVLRADFNLTRWSEPFREARVQ